MRLWTRTSKDLSSDSTDAWLASRRRQARFRQALLDGEQRTLLNYRQIFNAVFLRLGV